MYVLVRVRWLWALAVGLALGSATLTGCTAGSGPDAGSGAVPAHWIPFLHVPRVVDLAGPGPDGSFTVAAAGHLLRLSPTGALESFAGGPGGYSTAVGPEPYITATTNGPGAGQCAFGRGAVFAIEPRTHPGVIMIDSRGRATRFADLPRDLMPNGITYDSVGAFRHRLLVTAAGHGATTLFAIDCKAAVSVVMARGPAVEGGITVAPRSFGRFGGDLIAPNETSGRIFAFLPDGKAKMVVESGLPSGGDIGVESAGFVPPGFTQAGAAYLADRVSRGNAHPGTNHILELAGPQLARVGARSGDLLVASEGGAKTILVRCADSCTVRHIADGPAASHGEGHIVFAPSAV
jgi:hypothetical protein